MLLLVLGPSILALGCIATVALCARWPGPVEYPALYLAYSSTREATAVRRKVDASETEA